MTFPKKILFPILFFLSATAFAGTDRKLPVVPYPSDVVFKDGYFNASGAGVSVSGLTRDESSLAKDFGRSLKAASGPSLNRQTICFRHVGGMAAEEYSIDVSPERIEVLSSSYAGTLYAIRTLMQIMPIGVYSGSYRDDADWNIPCVRIKDRPRFGYRGMLLDCSRHFFGIDEIRRILDLMSYYKLNRFHWHLSDDHGWRAEIRKYPLLTEIGSYRDGTMIGKDLDSNDGIRYGGYYTQEQMREVVEYASRLGIEVIPEIDLPAHIVSALAAYPHLGCTGGPYRPMTVWDISPEILCVGKESTFEFIEDVLDEICEIFPSEYIHIGGDECPKERWHSCPSCQARIHELGLKDSDGWTAEHYLQNYVTARIQKYLQTKGRKIIGWDEILEGDLAEGATVMSWRGVEGGKKAASGGFDTIMTPCDYCYLDYCQYDRQEMEPLSIGHYLPVQKCYGYEPLEGIPEAYSEHILGVQCNLWTEFIATDEHLEYMLLPRLLAVSEVQWSSPEVRCYSRFRSDLVSHQFPLLESLGYNFSRRAEEKVIALTFDDGPAAATTPQVLDTLEKYGIQATFFVIGSHIDDTTSAIVSRALEMGCEIANHTYTHPHLAELSDRDVVSEISLASDVIENISGSRPKFFRFPYSSYNDHILNDLLDLTCIHGMDSKDWDPNASCAERIDNVLSAADDGRIILLHDYEGNDDTVKAIGTIIPELLQRGYRFVTLSELFRIKCKSIDPDDKTIYSYL